MRKALIIVLLIMLTVPMTGCWNRRELSDLAIAVGLGIDKVGKNQYKVSVQVVDPSEISTRQGGGGGKSPITVYEMQADTIFEALRKMTTIAPRKIYLAHLRIIVLGETVAKEGIGKSLEFLSRDHEIRSDFFLVLAKETKASDILKAITPLEKIPSQKLFKSLEVSQKAWAPTHTVRLDELISSIISEGKSPVLTGVHFTGEAKAGQKKENVEKAQPDARLEYANLAVLRKDKIVGWFNEKESKGFSYTVGEVKNTVGDIPCPKGGVIVIEVFNTNTKLKVKKQNGKPKIVVELYAEVNVGEVRCDIDLTKQDVIEQMEKAIAKVNQDIIMASVKKAKKLKADVFGFGEVIHRSEPEMWKKLKKNWNTKGFVDVPVEVHPTIKIRRTGTTGQTFLKEMKE